MAEPKPGDALDALGRAEVELVVVGMTAAILQGAPMLTNDVDIVHRRTPENVERLLRVLEELGAVYRTDRRRLPPKASALLGPGHNLFETRAGDLDCLGTIDQDLGYEELLPDSTVVDLGAGVQCRVLLLARVIEIKQRAGRPKDLAALPMLRATLDEIGRQRPQTVRAAASTTDRAQAFAVRRRVFIEEQGVDAALEQDDHDASSEHVIALADERVVGAARYRRTERGVKLERVAVLPALRGQRVGSALVLHVIAQLAAQDDLYVHAQQAALGFWERMGFVAEGPTFHEAGIPHRLMRLAGRQ